MKLITQCRQLKCHFEKSGDIVMELITQCRDVVHYNMIVLDSDIIFSTVLFRPIFITLHLAAQFCAACGITSVMVESTNLSLPLPKPLMQSHFGPFFFGLASGLEGGARSG